MKRINFNFKSSKIPAVLLLLGCFAVIAATADYTAVTVPTSGRAMNDRKTIVIDAGHGGMDSGAVGINGALEKNINLNIVLTLRDMLTLGGFDVVLTRDSDRSIHDSGVEGIRNQKVSDMENRLEIVKSHPECIFLSVHQNLYTQPQYFGAQIFYNQNNPDNQRFAQIMQDKFRILQPENDRSIKLSGDELYLFKDTAVPAILVECGFLSNPDEAELLSDEEYQRKVAFTIYSALTEYLKTASPQGGTPQATLPEQITMPQTTPGEVAQTTMPGVGSQATTPGEVTQTTMPGAVPQATPGVGSQATTPGAVPQATTPAAT